jgi:hypothetical protein
MRSNKIRRVLLLGAAVVGPTVWSACQSLEVTNPGAPGIDVVYGSGENLEAALIGSWRAFWGVSQGARTNGVYPVKQISVWGNELTTADADNSGLNVTQEPRVAIDNRDQGGWTNRKPWYDLYESMSTAREAYQAIEGGLKVGPVTAAAPNGLNTQRAKIFAKFVIALDNLYLALLFDKGFPADEKTDIATYQYELKPYTEMAAVAIRLLRETIAEAKAGENFTLPTTFINGQTITRDDLVRIMYSYLVRAEVYMPRTPTERAAVNWALVLAQLDSGITKNFSQQAELTIGATLSSYYQYSHLQTNGRTNNRLVGPADTSGEYQRWLARPLGERNQITIVTPDRRIHGATPTTAGKYFAYLPNQTMPTANGTYTHSRYRNIKYLIPTNNYHQTGLITTMSVDEMKFIRAEALWRLGRFDEAAALINPTRVANNLKPVTASGPPAGADCVPRKDNGACGDLFDAIQYEKRIELFPTEAIIAYADARGWGKLLPGTPMHMPVHGRELETLGLPYYTIGGGGPGSAP